MRRSRPDSDARGVAHTGPSTPASPADGEAVRTESLPQRLGRSKENGFRVSRRNAFSLELVKDAQALFSEEMGRDVSAAEAREMLGDLTDFYRIAIATRKRRLGGDAPPRGG